jgi:hypothetical protein
MSKATRRWASLVLGSVVLVVLVNVPLVRHALADERSEREVRDRIRPGIYTGRWHSDKVRFIIEEVSSDGTFSGVVHFDKTSNFPDALFVFTGEIGRQNSITIKRDPNNDKQVSRAGEPRREEGNLIWVGETKGDDLDKPYVFELRIPLEDVHRN